MMLQTLFSAQQCFDQLLMVTLAKLDKLESILKQQGFSEAEASLAGSLIRTLRQQFSKSQVWLVDKNALVSPLDLAQAELASLTDLLQSARLPMNSRGAVGMIVRSVNTYINLLNSQAQQLRHQHMRQMHKPVQPQRVFVH